MIAFPAFAWAALSLQVAAPPPPRPPAPVGEVASERWRTYVSPNGRQDERYFYDEGTVSALGNDIFEFRFSVTREWSTTIYRYRVDCRNGDALSLREITVIRDGDVLESQTYEPAGLPYQRPAPDTVWMDVANDTCI